MIAYLSSEIYIEIVFIDRLMFLLKSQVILLFLKFKSIPYL